MYSSKKSNLPNKYNVDLRAFVSGGAGSGPDGEHRALNIQPRGIYTGSTGSDPAEEGGGSTGGAPADTYASTINASFPAGAGRGKEGEKPPEEQRELMAPVGQGGQVGNTLYDLTERALETWGRGWQGEAALLPSLPPFLAMVDRPCWIMTMSRGRGAPKRPMEVLENFLWTGLVVVLKGFIEAGEGFNMTIPTQSHL